MSDFKTTIVWYFQSRASHAKVLKWEKSQVEVEFDFYITFTIHLHEFSLLQRVTCDKSQKVHCTTGCVMCDCAPLAMHTLQCTNISFHTQVTFHTHAASLPDILSSFWNIFTVIITIISTCLHSLVMYRWLVRAGEFVQSDEMPKKLNFNFCMEACITRCIPVCLGYYHIEVTAFCVPITTLYGENQCKAGSNRNFFKTGSSTNNVCCNTQPHLDIDFNDFCTLLQCVTITELLVPGGMQT